MALCRRTLCERDAGLRDATCDLSHIQVSIQIPNQVLGNMSAPVVAAAGPSWNGMQIGAQPQPTSPQASQWQRSTTHHWVQDECLVVPDTHSLALVLSLLPNLRLQHSLRAPPSLALLACCAASFSATLSMAIPRNSKLMGHAKAPSKGQVGWHLFGLHLMRRASGWKYPCIWSRREAQNTELPPSRCKKIPAHPCHLHPVPLEVPVTEFSSCCPH